MHLYIDLELYLRYINGLRECHTTIFRPGSWPSVMLGPARVIWQASDTPSVDESERKVLIICHPTLRDDILSSLRAPLQKGLISISVPRYNAFELVGPKSGETISRALRPVKGTSAEKVKVMYSR